MTRDITRLLIDTRDGDEDARSELFQVVYEELRDLARHQLRRRRHGTLQTTVLVHEAYLKLCNASQLDVRDRSHFFALAARAMRQVLVDHFRRKDSAKRGHNPVRLSLDEGDIPVEERGHFLLALDEALERLSRMNDRLGRVVEWRFFGGLTEAEIAGLLGVSERTVRNDWSKAKAWLHRELSGD